MTQVHDFQQSLAYSHAHSDAPWWGQIYERAFPNLLSMNDIRQDGWAQRAGIDRLLILESGRQVKIDEKVRSANYPDFLLEYWSSKEHKKPGWVAKDLDCDYIAYAFVPSKTCYLLPFLDLRRAWQQNGKDWVGKYFNPQADNGNYTTVSVAVPIDEVFNKINQAMTVQWEAVHV